MFPPPICAASSILPEQALLVLLLRSVQTIMQLCVVIDVIFTHRLVVVLERRTLVHDLKTLELLRTLETPSNPKVMIT